MSRDGRMPWASNSFLDGIYPPRPLPPVAIIGTLFPTLIIQKTVLREANHGALNRHH